MIDSHACASTYHFRVDLFVMHLHAYAFALVQFIPANIYNNSFSKPKCQIINYLNGEI